MNSIELLSELKVLQVNDEDRNVISCRELEDYLRAVKKDTSVVVKTSDGINSTKTFVLSEVTLL